MKKVCSKCKQEKDVSCFVKNKRNKDGLRCSCKLCNKVGTSRKEKRDMMFELHISKGYKVCSKCKNRLKLNMFTKDKTKPFGYSSSCKDCRRKVSGSIEFSKKYKPRETKECANCGKKFKPRNWQVSTNKTGLFYCCVKCMRKYQAKNSITYTKRYTKYILERDKHRCIISGRTDNLQIHHVKTRGSGGKDDYKNLVTLNKYVHLGEVHGLSGWKYKKKFEEYLKQFDTPDFWKEKMELYKRDISKVKQYHRYKAREFYNKNKKKINSLERKKELAKKRDEYCIKTYGLSYSQYNKKKRKDIKERKEKNKI